MVGKTLSHYKVIEKIGQGGMGEVYRAEDTNLSREVAIKVLPEQFTQDPQRLARAHGGVTPSFRALPPGVFLFTRKDNHRLCYSHTFFEGSSTKG